MPFNIIITEKQNSFRRLFPGKERKDFEKINNFVLTRGKEELPSGRFLAAVCGPVSVGFCPLYLSLGIRSPTVRTATNFLLSGRRYNELRMRDDFRSSS
jgi:hypothetical protein